MQYVTATTPTAVSNSQATTGATTGPIPVAVLDNLASRFRESGLYLLALLPDGTVFYHDAAAGLFFHRFVLPLIQYTDAAPVSNQPCNLRGRIAQVTAASPIAAWDCLPGVVVAAFPYTERRQLSAVILLAAKSATFKLGEDVVRVCSRLGLDGIWLGQQADEMPTYGPEAVIRQGRLLGTMLSDQVRVGSLESELNSLSGQLANTYEELSLIYQISGGMRITRGAGDFFKQACLDVLETMGVGGIGVAISEESGQKQEPVLYGRLSLPPGTVKQLADELMPLLARRKGPLLVNDLSHDKTFSWLAAHCKQVLAVPMLRAEQVLGCFFACDKASGEFDSQDSKLLASIANESAIYLENSVLFDDVHGLMMGLLHSLTSAVDAKDAYTCGHSERVAVLARELTLTSGMSNEFAERVYMAGLLHDVGKIGVPEAVLQKTGRLTPEEFEQMKKHPVIGARILKDVKQIRDLIPGVLHHHERYDGHGYPGGLSGENIPLMGRLMCLADCFDAMTSNRTYRKAMALEVALTEIRRCGGTQFDPILTEHFLKIPPERLRELLRLVEAPPAAPET